MRLSIRRRLLILSAAATLLVVGVASGFIWLMMRRSLGQALDDTLSAEARAIAGRVEIDHGRLEFDGGPSLLTRSTSSDESLLLILSDDGNPLLSSSELAGQAAQLELRHARQDAADAHFDVTLPPAGRQFRVLRLHAEVAYADEDEDAPDTTTRPPVQAWVFVARSLAPLHDTLARLGGILSLTAVAAGVVASALAALVARSGTAPIHAVSNALARINPNLPALSLDRRAVAIELDPVVLTVESLLVRIRSELERQRRLTADVAHDLRTPLAGVRTLLDVCMQRPRETAEYIDTISKALPALRQLSELVDDALSLARLEASVDQVTWCDASLPQIVGTAFATLRPLADARRVTLEADLAATGSIRTDRAKITKIMTNLLSNAVSHSPTGARVLLSACAAGGSLEIAVADQGPGVPANQRERIFERFVRGDAARSGDGHHGLGLPIARGLARSLGGDVTLDGDFTKGARFLIRLPLKGDAVD